MTETLSPRVAICHFNKPGSKNGFPWTVHVSGRCIPATEVVFVTGCQTIFRPLKKSNPRAWIRARGTITIDNGKVTIGKAR